MTSQINPANIDGAYPVAGQDNNSQGFRTNFTNTSTNFQYAAQEITDLQNKAVLKAALTGTTLNNNMNGSPLSNALLSDMAEVTVALGSVSAGTATINYSAGSFQYLSMPLSGTVTLAFSNFPISGQLGTVAVQVYVSNTAATLTLPAAVSVNNIGIQGLDSATNVITFAAPGTYTFRFSSIDNGTTITVNETNKALQPFNNSGENLSATGQACSLAVTSTKFTTTGAWTATLANGVYGQLKEFIMTGDGGDMVITVANAGWKTSGSGTITFTAIGQGCTLRWANSDWYCVGNNGCTFA